MRNRNPTKGQDPSQETRGPKQLSPGKGGDPRKIEDYASNQLTLVLMMLRLMALGMRCWHLSGFIDADGGVRNSSKIEQ